MLSPGACVQLWHVALEAASTAASVVNEHEALVSWVTCFARVIDC